MNSITAFGLALAAALLFSACASMDYNSVEDDAKRAATRKLAEESNFAVRDVLYLKNGNIIKGTLIELLPGSNVKIRTADGSIFVYSMQEVERVSKDTLRPAAQTSVAASNLGARRQTLVVTATGGLALPVSDFADVSNGAANLGGFGEATLHLPLGYSDDGYLSLSGMFSYNSLNVSQFGGQLEGDSWTSFWLLGGSSYWAKLDANSYLFGKFSAGLAYAQSPRIQALVSNGSSVTAVVLESAGGASFAYGGALGFIINKIGAQVSFYAANPLFKPSGASFQQQILSHQLRLGISILRRRIFGRWGLVWRIARFALNCHSTF